MGLKEELDIEKDHSKFLEGLLESLYGKGWENLTLFNAIAWHKKHFNDPLIKCLEDMEV